MNHSLGFRKQKIFYPDVTVGTTTYDNLLVLILNAVDIRLLTLVGRVNLQSQFLQHVYAALQVRRVGPLRWVQVNLVVNCILLIFQGVDKPSYNIRFTYVDKEIVFKCDRLSKFDKSAKPYTKVFDKVFWSVDVEINLELSPMVFFLIFCFYNWNHKVINNFLFKVLVAILLVDV